MNIFKKISLIALALITCSFSAVFFGCSKTDPNVINLSEVTHSTFYAPLYVAINKGYFKDEGLTINLSNGGGSNNSMSALVSNAANIVLVGPETVVYTQQEGIKDKPVVIGQLTQTDGAFIVARNYDKDVSTFTLDELKGESIIGGREGGLPAMTLQYVIEEAGLTIGTNKSANNVDLISNVEFNAIGSTFVNRTDVKYCTLFEPTATQFVNESNGDYKLIAPVGKFLTENVPYTCFVTKESFIKDHSEQAEKFLTAVAKGYKFLEKCVKENDLDKAAEALLPSFNGMTKQELGIAIKSYVNINAWTANPAMSNSSYNKLIDITANAGKILGEGVTYSNVVNNSIANKVNTKVIKID